MEPVFGVRFVSSADEFCCLCLDKTGANNKSRTANCIFIGVSLLRAACCQAVFLWPPVESALLVSPLPLLGVVG